MTNPAVSESSNPPEAFWSRLEKHFRQALLKSELQVRTFLLGGRLVRLEFAGDALVNRLTSALAHRECTSSAEEPALRIAILDSTSTGIQMPPPPWSQEACRERGEISGFNDSRFKTAFSIGSGALSMLDGLHNRGLFWLRDYRQIPFWEAGAPFLSLLHWWFGRNKLQLVHGAAVGFPSGGVLLAGKGGSGKSTSALACLQADFLYAGDDYCLLQTEPEPQLHSLYNSAKLNLDNLRFLPFLTPLWETRESAREAKALSFLAPVFPDRLTAGFPLRALLIPRITGKSHTSLSEASPAAALKALAPSTLFQLPGAGPLAFNYLAKLVGRVPGYYLNLGTDASEIPIIIATLLGKIGPRK